MKKKTWNGAITTRKGRGKKPKHHVRCDRYPKCPRTFSQEWTMKKHVKQNHEMRGD